MKKLLIATSVAGFLSSAVSIADENSQQDISELKTMIQQMRQDYEKRISELESRLAEAEQQKQTEVATADTESSNRSQDNAFNPAISLILEGKYASYKNDPESYELPGFALGGEAELTGDGFSLGHSELSLSANVDNYFYGKLTAALAEHEGETEIEIEEAFIQTLGLGNGITVRAGRFFPAIGYLNQQHPHAWDFADAPLVYRGMWGQQYIDDGMRISWIAPTDLYLELGTEILAGSKFPAGSGGSSGFDVTTAFTNLGGDISLSSSWQAGISYYSADVTERQSGGHSHGGGANEIPTFSGDSDAIGLNAIYKWAPSGNFRNQSLTLQGEYFYREEDGIVELAGSSPLEQTTYDGKQNGLYLQGVYQFQPQWRAGLRYDYLTSDNKGSDTNVLEEAGLDDEGINPTRWSAMLDWTPSEFSLVRLQYNRDESYEDADDQLFLQYVMSLGAHGAHSY